jgi:hypothetical protein
MDREPRKLVAPSCLHTGFFYLVLFVWEGSQDRVVFWHIFAGTYTQSCESLLFIGLVTFLRHPQGPWLVKLHEDVRLTVLSWVRQVPLWDEHPTAVGKRGGVSSGYFLLTGGWKGGEVQEHSTQGLTHVVSRGLWWNWMEGSCIGRGQYCLTKSWNLVFCTCWDINLERAFSIQGPNRGARRSIRRGPARGNTQEVQLHVLSQKDHELPNFCLLS